MSRSARMANNEPSPEFIQKCKKDFKNRLEGAIKDYFSSVENRPNVFIPDEALWEFMDKHINFEYNEQASEYTVSALPTATITAMGVGRLTKGAAGGGAGGAAVGAVGGAGAGAGVGAIIGIVGGPVGVAIGAGIGAGVGAAMGGATGVVSGGGFGGWIMRKFVRDICLKWEKIHKYLPGQMKNDVNDSRKLNVTLKLDVSPGD